MLQQHGQISGKSLTSSSACCSGYTKTLAAVTGTVSADPARHHTYARTFLTADVSGALHMPRNVHVMVDGDSIIVQPQSTYILTHESYDGLG